AFVLQTNVDSVAAQTNIEVTTVQTNFDAVAMQTNINAAAVREMSLQDCFQEALSHNFDVQIERYNPKISLYGLNAAYAGYDPLLNFSATHKHDVSGPDGSSPSVSSEDSF